MGKKSKQKPVELDGRTGEGGGQLVRIAVALAAVTATPVRIVHVRGNREGRRGGGLKSQHVTSIAWLAAATGAEVSGLEVGSHTLEFRPARGPALFLPREDGSDDGIIRIVADSPAASALLVFQAVFPFLLFAGARTASSGNDGVIRLEISGGTNVSWSPSFEYVDQVLLPALEDRFGVRVERRLEQRGWSAGGQLSHGRLRFGIRPLRAGETLKPRGHTSGGATDRKGVESFKVEAVDASVIVPHEMQEPLTRALARDLEAAFPAAEVNFKVLEDSEHEARVYVLLVARSGTLRWGRDILLAEKRKGRTATAVAQDISRRVTRELEREVAGGREVDEFLQDQLVVFQALAEGRTHFLEGMKVEDDDEESGDERDVRGAKEAVAALELEEERMRRDKAQEPFGFGSLHATTARWVTAELLPKVQWFNRGTICEGVGMRVEKPESS